MSAPALIVNDLAIGFQRVGNKQHIVNDVVHDVSFDLYAGETLALVGESGSGKSLTALSILQLLPYPHACHPRGSIQYKGQELISAATATLQRIRGNDISMIFQEPMTALNPLHVVQRQIGESLALHQQIEGDAATTRIVELLNKVGIHDAVGRLSSYPHQLSGGQRQRVMIAMALANRPDILLADEPTTALDVTVQAKILALLKGLQRTEGLGVLLITHDLNMVRKVADRVLVMKDGRLRERGPVEKIFMSPADPYTRKLLTAEPPKRQPAGTADKPVLEVDSLRVWFPVKRGLLRKTVGHIKAVNDARFRLYPGQTLGVVGESGSGKTSLALALLKLVKAEGRARLHGRSLLSTDSKAQDSVTLTGLRKTMQIVFQDPYGSLSPRMSVGEIISEGLVAQHLVADADERDRKVIEMLEQVEIDPAVRFRYPHEFSGGQRQRIAIARALILEPEVLFLDEPTSALDRTVQVQVLDLLNRIQRRFGLAYIFISHDLSVVRCIADEVLVMKQGDVVEQGSVEKIFNQPEQTYTRELLAAAFDIAPAL